MKYDELNHSQIKAIVNKLGGMDGVQHFLAGHCEVVVMDSIIDLDANPFVPEGWSVPEGCHQKGGQFKWDASKVSLYHSERQKNGKWIGGNKFLDELKGKPVHNANLLDYLLANQHLIPEEWKGKYVFFWGTVYHLSDDRQCVRCLYWSDDEWYWGYLGLDLDWHDKDPAAVSVS